MGLKELIEMLLTTILDETVSHGGGVAPGVMGVSRGDHSALLTLSAHGCTLRAPLWALAELFFWHPKTN